jgi:Fe-S-cluster-containing dehydrogenase component
MSNEMTNDQFNPENKPLSLVEMAQRDDFEAYLLENHPREAAVLAQKGMDRRSFLKIMGASLALSGLGLTGCAARPSGEPIIPYTRMPEEITAGIPLFYASTFVLGGYATGILLETHEARPARIEGNPNHPASLGSSSAMVQASILDLYNPERSTFVRNNNELAEYEAFLAALAEQEVIGGSGEGLRILTETVTSPTLASQLNALLEAYPDAVWYQYESLARDNVVAGSRLAFDDDINTFYSLENATVILGLGGDFLSSLPGSIRYASDFANGRRVREGVTEMSRLYAVEATPGLAGAAADHRLSLRASEIEDFARALAAALGVAGVDAPDGNWDAAWLDQLVADLQAAGSQSVIIPGDELSPAVHALVHAMNAELGNVGETVNYTPSIVANPTIQVEDLAALVEEMNDGDVEALFILGGNPVYTAPADLEFADALAEVPFSVHLSLYNDETSQLATWHLPQTHFIEEWSDALAYDGAASLVQPPIGPLYDTVRSAHDVLALLLEDERSNYDIVREYWQEQYFGTDFDQYWRTSLNNGVLADTAPSPFNPGLSATLADSLPDAPEAIAGLEVVYRADPAIWDGRFASIAWLQELPDPLTKVTWDNAAMISAATAAELRVETNRLIELTVADRTVRIPVYITTGQPDNVITVSLGYGRGLSADLNDDENFNAGALRTSDAMYVAGNAEVARVRRVPNTYPLAASRLPTEVNGLDPVRSATLATFIENPEFAHDEDESTASLLNQPFEYDGNAWGMTIDLTACIGCNACMIACQMENNIPTVGREGVERARDMSWIRVDRHYSETETGELDTKFQPVPCMHCEEAPCEIVCPVSATVHNHEGLNQMVYNRCIGTRYCSANCPYGVRRFNFLDYVADDAILLEVRNPNVSVRAEGVMEKCTYCVQRINRANSTAKIEERPVMDGEVVPACAAACPTKAIVFGNINDAEAQVTQTKAQPHNYAMLGHLNVKPRTTYLARITNPSVAAPEEAPEAESSDAPESTEEA